MTLITDGRRIPVAQIGNSGLMVRHLESPVPPREAMLCIAIDDNRKRHRIILPNGISAPNTFVDFF